MREAKGERVSNVVINMLLPQHNGRHGPRKQVRRGEERSDELTRRSEASRRRGAAHAAPSLRSFLATRIRVSMPKACAFEPNVAVADSVVASAFSF